MTSGAGAAGAGGVVVPIGAAGIDELGTDVLDRLLDRSADATLLIDAATGTPIRRWHDPERSRLRLPDAPVDRVIGWVHPDDVTTVLDALASVAHDGGNRSSVVRIHPDRATAEGQSLMVLIQDVSDVITDGLLLHVWLVDFDAVPGAGTGSTMSSLAEAAPVGLQVRSGNGNVSFENERFADLAAADRDLIDTHVVAGLVCDQEYVQDLAVAGRSLRLRVVPTCDAEHRLLLAVASLEDITSLRAAEAGRAAAEGLFRAVFDDSPVATAVVDLDGRFVQVNEALAMICGRSADELLGCTFADITHPDDHAIDQELLAEVLTGRRNGYRLEKRYVHGAGHEVWVELTVSTVRDTAGGISHLVAHVEDISARKAALGGVESTDELAYWATHDHLTGLPNRRYLDNFLTSAAGPRRRADDRLVVLFLDLDDFKPVNDRWGHQAGDEVLRVIARRLRNTAREDELVARYGGDEFVVVTRKLRTAYDVSLLSERILSAVRTPILGLADEPIRVGASVGIGLTSGGEDPGEVLRRADEASYRAKREGKGRIRAWSGD